MENGHVENGFDHIVESPLKKQKKTSMEHLLKHSNLALERFARKNKDNAQDVKQLLRILLTNDAITSLLVDMGRLEVFSHDIHQALKGDLQVLGAVKQLKYFYSIPLGQMVTALADLFADSGNYGDLPTSQWWSAIKGFVLGSKLCQMKTCDFLRAEGMVTLFSKICFLPHAYIIFVDAQSKNRSIDQADTKKI